MVEDDTEINNAAGKHDYELGNNITQLDRKSDDAKNKIEGDKFPCSADTNKNDDLSQSLTESIMEANDNITLKNEIEDQTNLQRETNEPLSVEGSTDEHMNTVSKNKETNVEEQNGPTDVKNEVVEHNPSNGGVEADKSAEASVEEPNSVKDLIYENADNGVEGEAPLKSVVEENHAVDCSAEKHNDCERTNQKADTESDPKNTQFSSEVPLDEAPSSQNAAFDEVMQGGDEKIEEAINVSEEKIVNDEPKEQGKEMLLASPVTDEEAKTNESATKHEVESTPNSLVRYMPAKAGNNSGFTQPALFLMAEGDDGTPEEQALFMKEIESFYRERAMDFKPPKFYGQPLNCLKLWTAVIRLGGYDRVTGSKLWRQVGESFHPPKTCTTVSWTFRIFYEKSLLEYERHKTQSGELQLPVAAIHEASGVDAEGNGYQGSGSGRARRDSAARAMQPLFGGEVGEPVIKDKNITNMSKREKNVKTIGSLKQKRPNEVESSVKVARVETSKQLATTVVDVGPPADWVKINVRQTKDCFEVYALVPGLLREEVRVQSDPAGRVVITGQPEQVDNPWGITPFKKIISLPSRINPLQTSAVVSLHGRLFVRVPIEQSKNT